MRRTPPLRVDFERSRLRVRWIWGSHGATSLLVSLLPLSVPVRGFAVLLLVALALRALRDDLPAGLVVRTDGSLVVLERDGHATDAMLVPGGYTGAWVTTILLRAGDARRMRTLLVLPDMLPAGDFRRLRVRLRYAINAEDALAPTSQACASTSAALSPFG